MPGTASSFLKFNIDSSMMQILALEDHLRRTSARYESEEASCLVKHVLQLNEQSLEGISHAAAVGDKEKVQVFKDLQRGAEHLREQLRKRVDPMELINEVRALRKRAEALDPTFNLEKCASCGDLDEEGVEKIKALQAEHEQAPRLRVVEEGMAHLVLQTLSEKRGVKPPELEIRDDCNDPSKAVYQAGKITVCRGGVNQHVLTHEWKHYEQDLAGKSLDEDDAERFAVATAAHHVPHRPESGIGLNSHKAEHTGKSEAKMAFPSLKSPAVKQLGMIYGASAAGTLADPLNNWVDANYPGRLMGQNPSLGIDALVTVLAGYGALKSKRYDIPIAVIGGSFLQDLIRRHLLPRIPGMPLARVSMRQIVPVNTMASMRSNAMTRPSVRLTPTNGPLASSAVSRGKFAVVTA